MPSNDVRILLQAAVPTAAVGAIAAVDQWCGRRWQGSARGGLRHGGRDPLHGHRAVVLQRTAKSLPQLFQAMGLMLYTAQLLLLFIFVAAFKDTTLFNPKAFAASRSSPPRVAWMARRRVRT